MTPSESTVRDALRSGRWGVLDDLASSGTPYAAKAAMGLVAATETARLLARDPTVEAKARKYFGLDGSRVLLSPFGLDPPGGDVGPDRPNGHGGPARPGGTGGGEVLAVSADGTVERVWDGADVGATVRELAGRHGWELGEDRQRRFLRRAAFPGFLGLGRFEFHALLNSPEGRAVAGSAPELADVVYPLWRPWAMGLTLTYRCNAACEHCFNVSGPKRSADCLGWSETGEHLTEWVRLGVSDIGLSGGEPFLYPDLVVELVAELKALGVSLVSPFSNGFLGADEPAARDVLKRLRAVGFGDSPKDQVKISAGEFHARFIDSAAVLTLAALHHEIIGNPVILDIDLVRTEADLRRLVHEAKERGIHDRIQWMARPAVSDSGRAKRWYDSLPHHERALSDLRCPIRGSASLYPAGDWVYCSGTSWPADYRRVGSLGGDSPYTTLARAQRDPRVPYWQFGTFADWLRDHPRPGLDPAGAVRLPVRATVCGTCRDVFGPPRRRPAAASAAGGRVPVDR